MSASLSPSIWNLNPLLAFQTLLNEHQKNFQRNWVNESFNKESIINELNSERLKRKKKRDASAFWLFWRDYKNRLELQNKKLSDLDISLECSKVWAEMSDEDKDRYVQEYKRLSEMYHVGINNNYLCDEELQDSGKTFARGRPPKINQVSYQIDKHIKEIQEKRQKDQAWLTLLKVDNDDIFGDNDQPLIPIISYKKKSHISSSSHKHPPIFIVEKWRKRPKILNIDDYDYLSLLTSKDLVISSESMNINRKRIDNELNLE